MSEKIVFFITTSTDKDVVTLPLHDGLPEGVPEIHINLCSRRIDPEKEETELAAIKEEFKDDPLFQWLPTKTER